MSLVQTFQSAQTSNEMEILTWTDLFKACWRNSSDLQHLNYQEIFITNTIHCGIKKTACLEQHSIKGKNIQER